MRVGDYHINPPGRLADPAALAACQTSRPFLEHHLRRRVGALANVTVLDGHDVVEPVWAGKQVVGVRIANRRDGATSVRRSDLVVDATGRTGRSSNVLSRNGFDAPSEERTASAGGYSSQLVRVPKGRIGPRMAFVNNGSAGPGTLLVAYEDDTWMLAVYRPTEHGGAPVDFAEMMVTAERLLPADVVTALREAARVGETSIARTTAAVWRRYDLMPRVPAGLIVLGDALCHLNPMYGQGITVAALQALALRDCLEMGVTDLPRRFYQAAAEHVSPVWSLNRANDRVPDRTARGWLLVRAQRTALRAAGVDVVVAERILRVRGLVEPAARLDDPRLWSRILRVSLRSSVRSALSRQSVQRRVAGRFPRGLAAR